VMGQQSIKMQLC